LTRRIRTCGHCGAPPAARRFTPYHGADAEQRARGMVRQNAWLLYAADKAPNAPDQFGIERP
jgi:hypothetical protein